MKNDKYLISLHVCKSASLYVPNKSDKNRESKFITATYKNPELPHQKFTTPFPSSSPSRTLLEKLRHLELVTSSF